MSSVRPDDPAAEPMAPPTEVWARLSPSERAALRLRLGPMPIDASPPVGDAHIDVERLVEDAVGGWLRRRGTRAYIGRGITVYYPGEPRFAPDFFVVFDVDPGPRTSFIVDHEGKGLDFVLEIHASGDRAKDLATNVDRYARLNIPEYFFFDVGRQRIHGWRQGARPGTYVPVLPQGGRWRADHLGAELGIVDTRLRFFVDAAMLPLESELRTVLSSALDAALERAEAEAARAAEATRLAEDEARRAAEESRRAEEEARRAEEEARRAAEESRRAEDEARRAEEETRRAEEETRRADALAAENAELRATLARLRGETPRD